MAGAAEGAQGQASQPREETEASMGGFRTSRTISKFMLDLACREPEPGLPRMRVTVLRNRKGDIGGYAEQTIGSGSWTRYVNWEGGELISVHGLISDDSDDVSSSDLAREGERLITEDFLRQFPVKRVLRCPKGRRR